MPYAPIPTSTATALSGTFGAPRTSVGKTLATLRAEVLLRVKNRSDALALVDGWINDAYREMCAEVDFPELSGQIEFSTSLAQPVYKFPAGAYTLKSAALQDATLPSGGYPLMITSDAEYKLFEVATSEKPTHCFQYEEEAESFLVLWPEPLGTQTVTFTFKVTPQPLVADTDSPLLDARWHFPLMLRARAVALAGLGDEAAADKALEYYLASLRPKLTKPSQISENQILSITIPRKRSDLITPPAR